MSFVEGMIICFIGGWLNSWLYSRHLRKKNKASLVWFAIVFVAFFLTLDVLIYLNIINARLLMIWPWLKIPKGVDPGKYWMFNPGLIFGINLGPIIPGDEMAWTLFAAILFISYIWWFTIGQNMGRIMYGRLSYEKGIMYLLRTTKMVKKSKEKLEKKLASQ